MAGRALADAAYGVLVMAGGFACFSQMIIDWREPNWGSFSVLLLMACATAAPRFPMPGVDRTISISFWFTFAAITEEPALLALFIAAAVQICALLAKTGDPAQAKEETVEHVVFHLSVAACCIQFSYLVYHYLADDLLAEWAVAAIAAASVYYILLSIACSLRMGLIESAHPWKIWKERFFWSSPVYMLAPAGITVAKLLVEAESYLDTLLGLTVIFGGYWYLRSYFPRLLDCDDQAERSAEIQRRALETLGVAIEAKDGGATVHLQRVKLLAARLARKLDCSDHQIHTIELAAVLHDVGKVGVPDYILQKPGRLTDREFEQISRHALLGSEIVRTMQFNEPVEEIVLSHHEHWDGSGYPRQLVAEQIPILARILTVADCFDALISDRPYRQALPISEAIELMRRQRARIFDPAILDAFLADLPTYLKQLEADIEVERQEREMRTRPAPPVRQTWLDDSAEIARSTEHQALRRLTQSPELLYSFYEILRTLGADLNYDVSLRKALRILAATCGADIVGIFKLNEGRYVLAAAEGLPEHCISRLSLSAQHGLLAHAAITRMPMIGDAPPAESPGGPAPRYLEDVNSMLAAPLIVEENVIGVLVLASQRVAAFSDEQGQFLTLLTEKLASTLHSANILQQLRLDAQTDPMTKLPNARAVFRRLEGEIARAGQASDTVGVVFMDLNSMKPVNDAFGHAAGDRLLLEVAQRLNRALRAQGYVGRVGGDEFLAILPGISRQALNDCVQSLKLSISGCPVEVSTGRLTNAAISAGAALFPDDGEDADDLVYLSDQRMYRDKQNESGLAGARSTAGTA